MDEITVTIDGFKVPLPSRNLADTLRLLRSPHFSEVQKAYDRLMTREGDLGGRAASAMAWLADFAETDLSELSEGRWRDLAYEIVGLTEGYGQSPDETLSRTPRGQLISWGPPKRDRRPQMIPSTQIITGLHSTVKKQFANFVVGKPAEFPMPAGRLAVWPNRTDNPIFRGLGDHPKDRFLYHSAQLLSKFWNRIRRCDGCSRIFLTSRGNQAFHDRKCLMLTYKRKERGTPPERYGKRGRPRNSAPRGKSKKGDKHGEIRR